MQQKSRSLRSNMRLEAIQHWNFSEKEYLSNIMVSEYSGSDADQVEIFITSYFLIWISITPWWGLRKATGNNN